MALYNLRAKRLKKFARRVTGAEDSNPSTLDHEEQLEPMEHGGMNLSAKRKEGLAKKTSTNSAPQTTMNKKTKPSSRVFNLYAAAGSAILVIILALVAMDYALLATGFSVVAGFMVVDIQRRRVWESKHEARLAQIMESHDQLVREVSRNRNDILSIKDSLASTAITFEDIVTIAEAQGTTNERGLKQIAEFTQRISETGNKPRSGADIGPDNKIMNLETLPKVLTPEQSANEDESKTRDPKPPLSDEAFDDEPMYSDQVIHEMLQEAVRERRVDTFMQPIVRLPQRKTEYYEVFGRIRAKAGIHLSANRYMRVAQQYELMDDIDTMLLMQCLKSIVADQDNQNAAPLFINIVQKTLKNTTFMNDLLGFLTANKALASRLVFEIPFSRFESLTRAEKKVLDGLKSLGCAFSIDHISKSTFDIEAYRDQGVRFIKLDAGWLLDEKKTNENGFTDMLHIKRKCEAAGIAVIAEKIETEDELRELLDYNINFGQGYLLGRPDMQGAFVPSFTRAETS